MIAADLYCIVCPLHSFILQRVQLLLLTAEVVSRNGPWAPVDYLSCCGRHSFLQGTVVVQPAPGRVYKQLAADHYCKRGGTRDAVDDPVLQDTVRKVIVLYLVFLAFLKDQWDVWGLQSKVKEIKGSWEDEVQRRKYAKEHESNSKVEEKRQKLFAQFGIDEDSLLETSSEYLNYTSEQGTN